MKKRVLAMFLSVCMALCLLPATALAAPAPEGSPFLYAFDGPTETSSWRSGLRMMRQW